MDFSFLKALLPQAMQLVALVAGAWAVKRIKTPNDAERAKLLGQIANDAAAYLVSLNPKASWDNLLRDLVKMISEAAGVPTGNEGAIKRAAASALKAHGVSRS